jgi:hypothetical protein
MIRHLMTSHRLGLPRFALALTLLAAGCGDDAQPDQPNPEAGKGGASAAGSGGSSGRAGNGTAGRGGGGAGQGATGGKGGSPAAGKGGGSAGDDGDAGTPDAGAFDPDVPLLSREPRSDYSCSAARPTALLGIDPMGGSALLTAAGKHYLARIDGMNGNSNRVAWSTIGLDGALGTVAPIYTVSDGGAYGLVGAAGSDRHTLAWVENGLEVSMQIAIAQVDGTGKVTSARRALSVVADTEQRSPLLIANGEGYAIVWNEVEQGTKQRMRFARLDATSALSGSAKTLLEGEDPILALDLVSTSNGLGLLYAIQVWGDTEAVATTYYQRLSADGAKSGDPIVLGKGARPADGSLIARGDQVLAAWTEWTGMAEEKLSAVTRIQRIAASGALSGPTYTVQESKVDRQNVAPTWVDFGDDLGLVWGEGSIIYVCAGCVPDDALRFVVLDGEDLTPASDVIELASPKEPGLTQPRVVRQGDSTLVVSSVSYHTWSEGASATIECKK